MIRRLFSHIDLMVRLLVLAIVLASVLPATGRGYVIAQGVSNAAIFLLFLLNGLRLPRTEVLRGISHWQFLLPLTLWCFGAMAVAGKGFASLADSTLPSTVALGLLYLGALPSTVQSATAYSSLAGGNVANSVIAAALLNILGVFVTVPIISLLGGGEGISLGADGLLKVMLILVLPFIIGQLFQARAKGWIVEHREIVTWMDRLSIAVAVYVAFSGAVSQGLWGKVSVGDWAVLLALVTGFLLFGFGGSWLCGRMLGLSRPDRIAFLFAGAHKSVAMGAPLAAVLFPPAIAGMVLLPLLAYHLLQLVVSAPLANLLSHDPNVG
ncbi:MAG: bile acid:sodium symporter [Tsuneonella suprasediminis]|uniref:Bile acid:sodium symporter n=1 Tax=Tsuneonella suprasediminis TaxID=2306996 RepID=A0A419R053_9SPHN|nr:bile acid:sodium symporter [Tsuneonella suprasediminis]RJX66870.1 bile acid:sodium symporter [Tsuneonella suprasediminis]UBS32316.1 bile acid:sodium symporter [Altererythrobacter sp. N1]